MNREHVQNTAKEYHKMWKLKEGHVKIVTAKVINKANGVWRSSYPRSSYAYGRCGEQLGGALVQVDSSSARKGKNGLLLLACFLIYTTFLSLPVA